MENKFWRLKSYVNLGSRIIRLGIENVGITHCLLATIAIAVVSLGVNHFFLLGDIKTVLKD